MSEPPRPPGPPATDRPAAGAHFDRLVEIMRALRAPTGCPWDRAQTLASLRPFVLEETYEVLDALDRNDSGALKGELGDLLFQTVFLSALSAEAGHFTIADVIETITQKLVRRHPHVFGDPTDPAARATPGPTTAGEVRGRWEQIKADEQAGAGEPRALLRGVPATLPALLRSYEIGVRAASVGFDWVRTEDVVGKIEEEVAELREAVRHGEAAHAEDEMGDLLFAMANLSRRLGIEPEAALRRANGKFCNRFGALERWIAARGRTLPEATLDELDAAWDAVKDAGRERNGDG